MENSQKTVRKRSENGQKMVGKQSENSQEPVRKQSIRDRILAYLTNNPGPHKTRDIAAAISAHKDSTSRKLTALADAGEIDQIQQGTYRRICEDGPPGRTEEQNRADMDKIVDTYIKMFDWYREVLTWIIASDTELSEKLQFLNNFRLFAATADVLLKRWSIVHVGYDTNTRQAQEDAKAKTRAAEQTALENAPLEDQVDVIGSFDLVTKQLIDNFPTMESHSKEPTEEIKV